MSIEKLTMTIEYVEPQARDWTSGDGKKMWFPEAKFADGSTGSTVAFSEAGAQEHIDALVAKKDVATVFELEADGEYQGRKKYRIKGFDGMPKSAGGGAARGGGGMSNAQAGLMAAGSALSLRFNEDVPLAVVAAETTELADILIEWLFKRRGGQPAEADAGEAAEGQAAPAEAPAPTSEAVPPEKQVTLPQLRQIKQLGKVKGLESNEELEEAMGQTFGSMTTEDAETLIGAWS